MANITGDIIRNVDANGRAQWAETHFRAVKNSAGKTVEDLDNEVNQLDQKVDENFLYHYFDGNDTTYVNGPSIKVKAGQKYRVYLRSTSWDYGTTDTSKYVFAVQYSRGTTPTRIEGEKYASGLVLQPYYDVQVPDDAGDSVTLLVGGRAAVGTRVWFSVIDTSMVVDNSFLLNSQQIVGAGTDRIALRYNYVRFVHPNSEYRVTILTPDWQTVSGNKLTIGTVSAEGVSTNKVTVAKSGTVRGFYDITTGANDVELYIGARCERGMSIDYMVEDITLLTQVNQIQTQIGQLQTNDGQIQAQIGQVITDISTATKRRVNTGGPTESATGTRYSIVFKVSKGDYIECQSSYSPGINIGVWSSLDNAFTASSGNVLQAINGDFTTNKLAGVINVDGYLGIRFKKSNNSSITDAELLQMDASLTLLLAQGLKGNIYVIQREIVEEEVDDDDIVEQAKFVSSSPTVQSLGLLHFTDIHGDQDAADEINRILTVIGEKVNDVLCSGDSVHYYADSSASYPHGSSWWKNDSGLAAKSLFVLGNHDPATAASTDYDQKEDSAAWDGKGKDWCFETYIEPYINTLGITMPDGYDNSSSPNYHACYWHKDYAAQKIRLIGLDCVHRFDGVLDPATGAITTPGVKWTTNEQELWLIDRLNETLNSNNDAYGYSVIVCCHYPLDNFSGDNEAWNDTAHKFDYNGKATGGRVMSYKTGAPANFHDESVGSYTAELKFNMNNRVDDGYADGDPYPNYTQGTTNNVGEILKTWMTGGGKMVAWICGHRHMDYMYYSTKYPDILVVVVDQAGCLRGTNSGNRSQTLRSRTCANYYSIDTQNGLFKIVRFGYTMNKYLNSHRYLCYDYVNKKVLNEG